MNWDEVAKLPSRRELFCGPAERRRSKTPNNLIKQKLTLIVNANPPNFTRTGILFCTVDIILSVKKVFIPYFLFALTNGTPNY